jgi:hypothetical protein
VTIGRSGLQYTIRTPLQRVLRDSHVLLTNKGDSQAPQGSREDRTRPPKVSPPIKRAISGTRDRARQVGPDSLSSPFIWFRLSL